MLLTVVAWQARQLVVANQPLPVLDELGGEFTLTSTLRDVTHLSDFRGRLVLLSFGYTGCPDVCPTTLARVRDVLRMLGEDAASRVQPLFITLDPDRDRVDRLNPYLTFFDESFVGLTGTREQIAEVADLFKVHRQQAADESYGISHSNQIYLLDQEGRVRATFSSNVTVPSVVETVARLL